MSEYTIEMLRDVKNLFEESCPSDHFGDVLECGEYLFKFHPKRLIAHTHHDDTARHTSKEEDKRFFIIENYEKHFVLISFRNVIENEDTSEEENLFDMNKYLMLLNPYVVDSLQQHTILSSREKMKLFSGCSLR